MSFLSGGKAKDKESITKKSQFYVEFLGWMECRGLRGERYTEPVIKELRRRHKKMEFPPKLTIQVSRKNLKITQEVEEKKRRGIKKIKFPTIPARDVTFVHQSSRPDNGQFDDIVACIYLGYMPRTQRCVHVHVYRFDEPETASLFVNQMSIIVGDNEDHIREVEIELASKGEIEEPRLKPTDELLKYRSTDSVVSSASRSHSDEESATFASDEIDPDLQSLADIQPFDSVTNELKYRLQMHDAPLLLPPKDYDTISRAHGNLIEINKRRCLNANIIGVNSLSNDSNDSRDKDVIIPELSEAETQQENSINKTVLTALKITESRNSPGVSPKLQHMSLPLKDKKESPQVLRKPTNFDEHNQSPLVLRRIDLPQSENPPSGSSNSGSSEIAQSRAGYVYPAKAINSPISPRMFPPSQGSPLSRQSSQNSQNSEASKLSNRSDDNHLGMSSHHYRVGPSDDIYTLPLKAFKQQVAPEDELPPDYHDDDELNLPGMKQQPQGKQYLTQSLPSDVMREKLKMGSSTPRPNSAELHLNRRSASPVFPSTGPLHPRNNGGMYSPQIHRNARR